MRELELADEGPRVRWIEYPGTGPVRVFLHGLGSTAAADWGHIAAATELVGQRTLLIDLLGHGLSDRPGTFSYTVADHAEVVARVLDHLRIRGAQVIGHSLGGTVAIVLAARRPHLVSRLVVSEPNLLPGGGVTSGAIAAQSEEAFVAEGFAALVDEEEAAQPGYAARLRLADPLAVHRSAVGLVELPDPPPATLLAGIDMPRALLVGERNRDDLEPRAAAEMDVPVYEIPGAGHNLTLENPHAVVLALSEALGSAPAPVRPRLADGEPGRPLRTAVVANPARVEDLEERRLVVDAALTRAGWPAPLWYETTREDTGLGQTKQAVADGAEVVFVCGGDGTVRACAEALIGTDVALAVLPAGTGNLLAVNLGLPDDPEAGVKLVVEMGRRRVDVGEVDGTIFLIMAGMGFDAQMLAGASPRLKASYGALAYVFSALRHIGNRSILVSIRLDDDPPQIRRVRTVLVGNVGRLQGGIRLLADAEPDNGQLDVAVIGPRNLGHWAALVWAIVRRHERVPRMEVFRARRVEVTSNRPQPRQIDGDVIARNRTLAVRVRPSALVLCVPQPERSPDLAEGAPS